MTVLFVCRGKKSGEISPVVKAQLDSLISYVDILLFQIEGRGIRAYLKSIPLLKQFIKRNKPDIIHAHYAHSGFVAALSSRRPVVCSLMGSDIEDYRAVRVIIRLFAKFLWSIVIVKSGRSKKKIRIKNAIIIPNGVNLEIFKSVPKQYARENLGLDASNKYALFLSDPARREKNFNLAVESCKLLAGSCELLTVYDKPHEEIPMYLSAVDTLLLTSQFEGSPNVIKEAMACGCPIVSIDVGDVGEICHNTDGTYICSPEPLEISEGIKKALLFGKRTKGRENLKHLDSDIIAKKITSVYKNILGIK